MGTAAAPAILPVVAFAAAAIVCALAVCRYRRHCVAMARWSEWEGVRRLSVEKWRGVLVVMAAGCGVLSFNLGQGGTRVTLLGSAADRPVVFALDLSRSMDVDDVTPTRREAAQDLIDRLVSSAEPINAGLVVFSGESQLLCPVTMDAGAHKLALGEVSTVRDGLVGGSDIGGGLARALDAVPVGGVGAAVVLLSDGELTSGDVGEEIERAVERGITVHAVGLGTADGRRMTAQREVGGRADGALEERVSRLEESGLRDIASATGGRYIAWSGPDTWRHLEPLLRASSRPPVRHVPGSGLPSRAVLLLMAAFLVAEQGIARLWRE